MTVADENRKQAQRKAAMTVLAHSDAAEIARLCGFVDASSFTQHFRKRMGMTPTAYRERFRRG